MDVYTFGELLKAFRKCRKISQQELARRMGKHLNTIGAWERGDCLPNAKSIVFELARELRLNEQETRQLLEASLIALSPLWYVPYQRNPFFTGRAVMLERLHQQLRPMQAVALSQSYALTGLGGIGKTQLVLEYIYQHVQDYHAVFWIAAETRASLVASFVTVARQLQLPEAEVKDQSQPVKATLHWFSTHKDWLLVFDHVENLSLLKSFFPSARQGTILITTRLHSLDGLARTLELSLLSPEEGLQFLLSRARLIEPTVQLEDVPTELLLPATVLVEAMGGLPLALDQAGAYIEATLCSLFDYLELFHLSPLYLLNERNARVEHHMSVVRTFAQAFAQLKLSNLLAAELLIVCSFLAPEAIPETIFIEGAAFLGPTFTKTASDPFALHAAIKVVLSYSLLQRETASHTLTIHRLVQVVLRERLSDTTKRCWMARVLHTIARLFPCEKTHISYNQRCEQLLSHALICIAFNELQDEEAHVTLIKHVALYLTYRARYTEAESLLQHALSSYKQALKICEQTLGIHHPKTVKTRTQYDYLLRSSRQLNEAIALETRMRESAE